MSYLEIRDLRYSRGPFSLEASLEIDKGKIAVLLGPSGCGKTTLLRCVAGLETPSSGGISVDGVAIEALPPERRKIGYVFQDLALFDHLTGRGNLEFGLRLRAWDKEKRDNRVGELASRFRIAGLLDRRPPTMSGGERQRLAFARSIAFGPDLLLLDEPLSSLDAALRKELRAFIGEGLRSEGVTALHVTHDVEEALELADLLFLMRDGRILSRGSPRELYAAPPDAWTVLALGLGSLLRVDRVRREDGRWLIDCPLGMVGLSNQPPRPDIWPDGFSFPLLFVPTAAVGLSRDEGKRSGVEAVVDQVSYMGASARVRTHLLPPSERQMRAAEAGDGNSLELLTEPTLRLNSGDRVRLQIDESLCRLVHDDLTRR